MYTIGADKVRKKSTMRYFETNKPFGFYGRLHCVLRLISSAKLEKAIAPFYVSRTSFIEHLPIEQKPKREKNSVK